MSTQSLSRRLRLLAILAATLTLATSAWPGTEKTLYSFDPFPRGVSPGTNLIFDSQGNLYGTTGGGGDFSAGTVFELKPTSGGGWKREILYSFRGWPGDGDGPVGELTFGPDGNIYGATGGGGTFGYGTAFQLVRGRNGKWTDKVLYNFNQNTSVGYFPSSGVVLDSEGNIYGTTASANSCGTGVVYELSNSGKSWTAQVIFPTCNTDSGYPNSVVFGKDGNLYGTTSFYGPNDGGIAYKLIPTGANSWQEETLYAFGQSGEASRPFGGLIFDEAGNLYGTSSEGGTSCNPGCGTVYELSPSKSGAWTETVLYSFTGGSDGGDPHGALAFDTAGNLYGTTIYGGQGECVLSGRAGCGIVFKLSPNGSNQWTESVIHQFKEGSRGNLPESTPVFDSSGNLYATTQGVGVLFELVQKSGQWQERVVESYKAVDGAGAAAPPTLAAGGKIYGTTSADGVYGDGTVFELLPGEQGTFKEVVIHNFNGKDGSDPTAGVVLDGSGNVYGTTSRSGLGGGNGCGSAFELSPAGNGSWRETELYLFFGLSGCEPLGGLVLDGSGNLYGTTYFGGANGQGAVFELSPGSNGKWSETVLYSFPGDSSRFDPAAGLIFDNAGNLYGTTYYGGIASCYQNWGEAGCGSVFELSPSSSGWTFQTIYSFDPNNDGNNPAAALTFDQNGNLYGTTVYGGASSACQYCGTAFELSPTAGGWIESKLYSFTGESDGVYPQSKLALDAQGNVYGMTTGYKNTGATAGSLFELTPFSGGWRETTLYDFDSGPQARVRYSVAYPEGGVVFDAAGHLIGAGDGGGRYGAGGVFEFVP